MGVVRADGTRMRPVIVRTLAVVASILLVLTSTVVDAAAAPGGATVSGTVTDADGTPLQDITVRVSSPGHSEEATTGADGTYSTGTLPEGSYLVSFSKSSGPEPRLPVQFWPKVWTAAQASQVVVSADGPGALTGIDAVMELPASVAGTVRDPDGVPLPGTCVETWLLDGDEGWQLGSQLVEDDGEYLLTSLPPVRVRLDFVDCTLPQTWLRSSSADLDLSPGTSLSGVDGVLEPGAVIAGTVRGEDGAPLADMCVTPRSIGDGGDWGETAISAPDGSFQLTQLDGGTYDLRATPCDDQPYLDATVTGVRVGTGETRTGVDLVVVRAATISGTVRDRTGAPVPEICVQVSDASSLLGSDETDEDGTYRVVVAGDGEVSVQYVDCADDPRRGGTELGLRLAQREDKVGVDVTLRDAPPASVTGTVTNVRGEPMAGVCVVGYLGFEHVVLTMTRPDGTFGLPPMGSGTWSVAYFGCPEGDQDEDPRVIDLATGVRWSPQWYGGALLSLDDEEGSGPDPLAAGASMLVLDEGARAVADHCFGCSAIRADMRLDGSTVRAEVLSAAMAAPAVGGAAVGAASTWEYSLSCRSISEPIATVEGVASATSADSLVLDGVDPGRAHRCRVTASVGALVVAVSDEAVLGVDPTPATGGGGEGADGTGGDVRPLAFVG
jgi:protocatechuate 3,4-dioxygenase beta subunit